MVEKDKKKTRWKAKPIIDVKGISLEEKQKTVEYLIGQLPEELRDEMWTIAKEDEEKKKKWIMWRPIKMTQLIVQKLKLCFSVGLNVRQACYFSWISKSWFYEYVKNNPDLLDEISILRESITMQARVNIWKSIKSWNVFDSWKWLEHKDSEFKNKMSIDVNWSIEHKQIREMRIKVKVSRDWIEE